jgi:hypothetical protein
VNFSEFKCRFCCALATFFCGGKAHFCTPCHDIAGQKVDFSEWATKWEGVVECPGFENCPLGVPHGMNGEEFSLGCAMCRAEQNMRIAEREAELKRVQDTEAEKKKLNRDPSELDPSDLDRDPSDEEDDRPLLVY